MTDNQQSKQFKTYQNQYILESGKKLYLNEKTADVHFSFDSGDGEVMRVPAHKNLLASVSSVFEAMFYGELKEKGDIDVVDVSDAAFKEFLQYFYLGEVKLTEQNIAGVIQLGDKYDVEKCFEDGIQFLIDTLNDENVCVVLQIANLYHRPELIKECETFIIVRTTAVLKSCGFLESDKAVLEHILRMNVLSCSEVEVFEACMAWMKAKSGEDSLSREMVDTHLGRLYYEIRFKSMPIQQFCSLTAKYDSVLSSDCITLMNMIVLPEFQPENFNIRPRQANWSENEIIECDRVSGDDNMSFILKPEYETIFSTNVPLLLGKFMCSKLRVAHTTPARDIRLSLAIDVKIIETTDVNGSNPKTLLKMLAKLQSKDTDVSLPQPVLVRPGFFYSICIGQFPDEHSYYSKKLKTEVRLDSDATIKFHKNIKGYIKDEAVVVGLISALSFNRI